MALSRRTGARFQSSIWPGFVDAMTGLLLVLMFVLTIFMVVQFVLTERISGQEDELDTLSGEVAALAAALGLEESTTAQLEARVGTLSSSLNNARDEATRQEALIASLSAERDAQDAALGTAQTRITDFEAQVAALLTQRNTAQARAANLLSQRDAANILADDLSAQRDAANSRAADLLSQRDAADARAADLVTQRDDADARTADLRDRNATLLSDKEALDLALTATRIEVDAAAQAAKLAASRREVLDALVAELRAQNADLTGQVADAAQALDDQTKALSDEEAARLADAAAAKLLRDRLLEADTELTSMTLALENQRKAAEDTLTLLAAARASEEDLNSQLAAALLGLEDAEVALLTGTQTEQALRETRAELALVKAELEATASSRNAVTQDRETLRVQLSQALAAKLAAESLFNDQSTIGQKQAALLAAAQAALSQEQETSTRAQRQTELLNQQVAALRTQLTDLQGLLDQAKAQDAAKNVQLQSLGSELNTALARVAAEQSRRAQLEAEERKRLEEETKNLEQYRSEFFGRLRDVLGSQEGVRIEGDRFVFSSEVLFPPGGAVLSDDGRGEIAKVASILRAVADDIPAEIDWVIRVDGHTDDVPLSGTGEFLDNWELSQGRALSVVKYMINFLGIPPDRVAANGFGQYQPIALGDSDAARAQNRRIELKFTEK